MVRLAVVFALFLFLHQDVARTQPPSCPGSSGVRSCTGLCRRSCQYGTCATHHRQHTSAGRSLAAGQLGAARAWRSGLLCCSKGCRRCTSRDWASRNVAVVPPVGGEAPWLRVAVRVAAVVRGQAAQRRRRALGRQAAQRVRRGEGLVERPCRALRACSSACTGRVGFLRTASLLALRARPAYSSVLVWFELLPHRLQSCSECRCRWRHCRSSSRSPSLPPSRRESWRVPRT